MWTSEKEMGVNAKGHAAFDDHVGCRPARGLCPAHPLDFADDRQGGGVGDPHFTEFAHRDAPKALHPILYFSRQEVKSFSKDFAMIFWRYVPGFSAEGEWPVANWGDILRMLRERLRFSQRELAQRAGVSTDAVYRAEKSSTPRLHGSTYRAIASALGVEPAEIDQMWKGEFTASVPLDEGRDRKGLPALPEAFMDEFVQSSDDVYVECYEGTGLPGGIRNGDLLVFSRIVTPVTGMIAAVELADQHGYISKHIGLIRRAKGGGIEVHQSMPGLQVYAPSVDIRAVHPAIVCLTPRRVYPVDTEPHLVLQLPPPRDPRRRRLRKER